mgnify:FL=1|tara:strand:+ start:2743 stop:3081 length:339 start_codon:yes stop_codon:yes gene_type:complete
MSSLSKLFGGKKKDLAKVVDENQELGEVTVDCPAIIELKQDRELEKELNIQIDSDAYTLDDMLLALGLSKDKNNKCNINIIKVNDSLIKIHFNSGKILLKRDGQNFIFDWEI